MYIWQKFLSVESNDASSYHRLARKELIDLFSGNRRRVIEIGSSGGYTGKYCKEKFSDTEYWGFELNQAAAKESLKNIDRVVCGKFEDQNLDILGLEPHSVDGVVLGDVLEHMYDPWRAMKALLPWLTQEAEISISIPNVRNLWLMNEIAEGRFPYDQHGLLDITHIRFFTLQEISNLLDSTGYQIDKYAFKLDERLVEFYNKNSSAPGAGPKTLQYKNVAVRTTAESVAEFCSIQFLIRAKLKNELKSTLPSRTSVSTHSLIFNIDESYQKDADHYVELLENCPTTPHIPTELYAFYLPQFHPTPLNSAWWGEGFTEWRNVTRARPSFSGHYQPRHPGALGYYDLRIPEVMDDQIRLARNSGLSGFIFYYYWFSGQRMLEKPLFDFMNRYSEHNFPFFVMWCNENWRRTWVDKEAHPQDLLMQHKHEASDPEKFIDDLHDVLTHPGYKRIDGKPILLVYPLIDNDGTVGIPETKAMVRRWREHARKTGIGDLIIGGLERTYIRINNRPLTTSDLGIDFFFDFPPNSRAIGAQLPLMNGVHDFYDGSSEVAIWHYKDIAKAMNTQNSLGLSELRPRIQTVLAGSWDNTARKGNKAHVYHGCTPPLYEQWLRDAVAFATKNPIAEGAPPMVFINAWNEWAEGVYLEPDRKYGYALLQATQRVAYDLKG